MSQGLWTNRTSKMVEHHENSWFVIKWSMWLRHRLDSPIWNIRRSWYSLEHATRFDGRSFTLNLYYALREFTVGGVTPERQDLGCTNHSAGFQLVSMKQNLLFWMVCSWAVVEKTRPRVLWLWSGKKKADCTYAFYGASSKMIYFPTCASGLRKIIYILSFLIRRHKFCASYMN